MKKLLRPYMSYETIYSWGTNKFPKFWGEGVRPVLEEAHNLAAFFWERPLLLNTKNYLK